MGEAPGSNPGESTAPFSQGPRSLATLTHCGPEKNLHGHSKAVPYSRSLAVLAHENTKNAHSRLRRSFARTSGAAPKNASYFIQEMADRLRTPGGRSAERSETTVFLRAQVPVNPSRLPSNHIRQTARGFLDPSHALSSATRRFRPTFRCRVFAYSDFQHCTDTTTNATMHR